MPKRDQHHRRDRDDEDRRELAVAHFDDEVRTAERREPVAVALGPVVPATHSRARNPNDGSEDQVEARHEERGDRQATNGSHCVAPGDAGKAAGMCVPCMTRQVSTNTATSAMPGSTAQAISIVRRRVEPVGASWLRAGAMMTERRIAVWAKAHETAENQNMTSVNRRGIERDDDTKPSWARLSRVARTRNRGKR